VYHKIVYTLLCLLLMRDVRRINHWRLSS